MVPRAKPLKKNSDIHNFVCFQQVRLLHHHDFFNVITEKYNHNPESEINMLVEVAAVC